MGHPHSQTHHNFSMLHAEKQACKRKRSVSLEDEARTGHILIMYYFLVF